MALFLLRPGYPWPKVNPNFGRINATLWQANSFYDALQVDLAKRASHGIQFHVAYTWGKSIDTLSASEADDSYPNGLFNQIFFDQRTTRGLSDFNVAQTFVLDTTWQIPSPRKNSKMPEWAFGGWQLVALYKASTGQPFTPILGGDPAGTERTRAACGEVWGREYLRIIYGPEYTAPEHLERLRARGLGTKRSLALREFALGVEALHRFVEGEPLRRVHECVFGVLALESEPVDPRL